MPETDSIRPRPRRVSLRGLDVEQYLGDPELRQSYVTPMFDLIAPRYDRFTRVFSFGMDRRWKASLVDRARASIVQGGRVCDAATGTGDLAFALARVRPDLDIAATDVSREMLALARARRDRGRGRGRATHVEVATGDIMALPFSDASLDAVTAGYALRNTPDWRRALEELARVLRPGGHLFTLDFYLPRSAAWRSAFLGWLWLAGRSVGWLWHREPMSYGYIAHSIRHFTTADGFATDLTRSGFDVRQVIPYVGGGIALHHAVRR